MKSYLILSSLLILVSACASKFKGKEVELPLAEEISPPPVVVNTCPPPTPSVKMCPCPEEIAEVKKFTKPKIIKPAPKVVVPLKPEPTKTEAAPKIEPIPVPWQVGERLTYQISALGLDAAEFSIEVKPKKQHRNFLAWDFFVTGKTIGMTTKLYYFNFKGESILTEQLEPLQFQTASFEGNDQKQIIEQYYPESNKYFVYKKRNSNIEKKETKDFTFPPVYSDPVSFFYLLRTLKINDSFMLLSNHKAKKIIVTSLKEETLNINNKSFLTEKLTLNYDGKGHFVWREKSAPKRILKAQISMSFANGTLTLRDP